MDVTTASGTRSPRRRRWVAWGGLTLILAAGLGWFALAAEPGEAGQAPRSELGGATKGATALAFSNDGRTLTFRSDRASEGRHQLYALDVDAIGEARALPVVEGVAELHAWSPNGTAVMVVVAGLEAEQSDAVGSGVIGQSEDLPP